MKSAESKYFITHFISDSIPDSGYIKLAVYTATDESKSKGIFYYGYGHREITLDEIDLKVKDGTVKELTQFELVDKGEVLWLDSDGSIWIANAKNPLIEKDGIFKFNGKKIMI